MKQSTVWEFLGSGKNGESAHGETKPVLRLWPGHYNQSTRRGDLVKVGHHFDLPMAVAEEPRFRFHFYGSIGIHGLVAVRDNAPLFIEKLYRLERPGGEWFAFESLGV